MADAGMTDEAVTRGTGHDWAHWKALLDGRGAGEMDHAAIARLLHAEGVPGWWSQMVTVGYERMIGRRQMGQTCAGDFSAGASRTMAGSMDEARDRWCRLVAERTEFAGATATGEPRLSDTPKWRYWKVDLDDGSRVSVNTYDKSGGKASLGINHDKLGSADAAVRAKAFWKDLLAGF